MATPERTGFVAYDAKDPDSKFPPIEQLRPPKGAPNVLVILIDDAGFGSSSAFGGPCQTPNAEKLASEGQFGPGAGKTWIGRDRPLEQFDSILVAFLSEQVMLVLAGKK